MYMYMLLVERVEHVKGFACVLACRKGTNGVSTNGVTANLMFFDRGTFGVLPLTYFDIPKSARVHFSPNLPKLITSAAAPLVLTPFVRSQVGLLRAVAERPRRWQRSGATTCLTLFV